MHREPQKNQESTGRQTDCRRCGTCCRKGGPALHMEDLPLLESGQIALKALFTIRQGEPAFDNVNQTIAPAVTDIVKIKGRREMATTCYFYEPKLGKCGRYAGRPAECRALKCWDVSAIEKLYNCRRLTRRHILSRVAGLWDLVAEHQDRCDYGYIAELAGTARRTAGQGSAPQKLLQLVRYDQSLRHLSVARMNLDPQLSDFLFGRPLEFTIRMFRVRSTAEARELVVDDRPGSQAGLC